MHDGKKRVAVIGAGPSGLYAAADSTFDEAVERAYHHMDQFVGGAEMHEGVRSFLERRQPRFAPLDPPA